MKTGQERLLASLRRRSLVNKVARAGTPRPGALVLLAVAAFLLLSALATPAAAEKRVALVIGNGAYEHVQHLPNPPHDAADIGDAFERLGYEVTRIENGGKSDMERGLLQFSEAASNSEIAVVFYAGHGMEVDNHNYLVPVDAKLKTDRHVDFEAVPMNLVEQAAQSAQVLSLIILDACRDNPFVDQMQQGKLTRSVRRGLARVYPGGSSQTLVAFAAAAGQVAEDGDDRNSPYTTALLEYIEKPELSVDKIFREVGEAVKKATGGTQVPHTYSSLSGDAVYLSVKVVVENPIVDPPTSGGQQRLTAEELAVEREFWVSVRDSTDPADFLAYLAKYESKNGTYVDLARNRLRQLKDQKIVSKPPPDSGPGVSPKPPPGPTPLEIEAHLGLGPDQKQYIQQALASRGFDPGPADGVFGKRTRDALEQWYSSQGRPPSRYLDEEAASTLLAVYAKLPVDPPDEPEPPAPEPTPPTTITLETVPANARIRVFTQSGSFYHDAMVVQPGPYEVAVNAPDHEEFRQPLLFDGPTKYRISLCKMEPQNQRICEDKSERRTRFVDKRHDKRLAGRASRSTAHAHESTISTSWGSVIKDQVRQICAGTREDVKENIAESCKQIGGRGVDRSTFVATLEECDYKDHRKVTIVEGTMVCKGVMGRVQESYDEITQECRNATKMVRVCPDPLVTELN